MPPRRRTPITPRPLADVVRDARIEAELSQRQLGERMGVSWVTVCEIERGRDTRHTTLQALLDALPGLSAHELVLGEPGADAADAAAAWRFLRDLHGFKAKRMVKHVLIGSNGDAQTLLEVRHVLPLRGSLRDRALLIALQRAICMGSSRMLRELEAKPGARTSWRDGDTTHEYVVPLNFTRAGLDYRVRQRKRGLFGAEALRAARAGKGGPFLHGTSVAVTYPVEELVLSVKFPPHHLPDYVGAHAWPATLVPDRPSEGMLEAAHGRSHSLAISRLARRVVLTVPRPLIELQYGIGWGPW